MSATATDLLATIVAATRTRVRDAARREPVARLEARADRARPDAEGFVRAVSAAGGTNIIAECKRRSPSRGILRPSYAPVEIARSYAAAGAAALSVLTEPMFFDGSLDHLAAVREAVPLPLLRKDFIVEPYQVVEARAAGADAVLLITAALTGEELRRLTVEAATWGLATMVEVHSEEELDRALAAGARVVGVNNRNLRTLEVDVDLSRRLATRLPRDVVAVSESGLKDPADLQTLGALGYRAFLIGERFMTAKDPGEALRRLVADARR
jgi:indole-3-glycerol phosphate synthase